MKIRPNPYFPKAIGELSNALGVYWRELATMVNRRGSATTTNANGDIGGLSIGATYSQAEIQALRDKCEILADDLRAIKTALQSIDILE